MDFLTLAVLAYLVGKGMSSGTRNVKDTHETNKKRLSPAKEGDKEHKGTNLAAGLLTAGTAAYTFSSGFKNGWKAALPEARATVKAQREKNRAVKEAMERADRPGRSGRPPLTERDGAGLVPGPRTAGAGPLPPGTIPAPPAHPPTIPGPAPAGPDVSAAGGRHMPMIEVRSVDTLVLWLEDAVEFATREREDASAAVKRIRDLETKVENAYNAAAASKYDNATLTKLAGLREHLAKLRTARQADETNSADAASNAATSSTNVLTRHGAPNEASAASPVEMAETSTYLD
ncbi:hypothetical protein ABZ820_33690 [Streptomyces diacarni]|uniref:hypothetical protein n=1 Tax=Streptomyces diacarni TaxID=2800381 RepID=UPI0033E7A819